MREELLLFDITRESLISSLAHTNERLSVWFFALQQQQRLFADDFGLATKDWQLIVTTCLKAVSIGWHQLGQATRARKRACSSTIQLQEARWATGCW